MADNLVRLTIALGVIAFVSMALYQFSGRPAAAWTPTPVVHNR
jgi:hypothetical protein